MRNKVIIASDGYRTEIFVNGEVYGKDIVGVTYEHMSNFKGTENPELRIIADSLPLETESKEDFVRFLDHLMRESE